MTLAVKVALNPNTTNQPTKNFQERKRCWIPLFSPFSHNVFFPTKCFSYRFVESRYCLVKFNALSHKLVLNISLIYTMKYWYTVKLYPKLKLSVLYTQFGTSWKATMPRWNNIRWKWIDWVCVCVCFCWHARTRQLMHTNVPRTFALRGLVLEQGVRSRRNVCELRRLQKNHIQINVPICPLSYEKKCSICLNDLFHIFPQARWSSSASKLLKNCASLCYGVL